jgi:hypothetical protein
VGSPTESDSLAEGGLTCLAAGGLALTGAVLAIAVHPYFAAIPALVGAGLLFAGVTDTCGMAMLLATMP